MIPGTTRGAPSTACVGRGAVDGVGLGCRRNRKLTTPLCRERSYRLENEPHKGLEYEAAWFNRVQESTVAVARRATVTVQQLGATPSSEAKLKGRAKEQQSIGIKSALLGRTAQFVQQQPFEEFFLQHQLH